MENLCRKHKELSRALLCLEALCFRRWMAQAWKLFHSLVIFLFFSKEEIDSLPVLLYIMKSQKLFKKKNVLSLFLTPIQHHFKKKNHLKMVP